MRGSFGNVANRSRTQSNSPAVDAEPPAAFDHVTDDVFVTVIDLLVVWVFLRAERDKAAGEIFLFKAILATNFLVDFAQPFECRVDLDGFHLRRERLATGNGRNTPCRVPTRLFVPLPPQ